MNDEVFIERLEPMILDTGAVKLTDDPRSSNEMILRKGRVLSVGPGKWVEGMWWKFSALAYCDTHHCTRLDCDCDEWEWIPGHRETLEVKPGMLVLFNARWNDLRDDCLKGTGSDGTGPLERPLSYRYDANIHLVQEADIAAIIPTAALSVKPKAGKLQSQSAA